MIKASAVIHLEEVAVVKKVEYMKPSFWRRVYLWFSGVNRTRFFSYMLEATTDDVGRVSIGSLILGQGNTGWEVLSVQERSNGISKWEVLLLKGTKPFIHCDILGNAVVVAQRK